MKKITALAIACALLSIAGTGMAATSAKLDHDVRCLGTALLVLGQPQKGKELSAMLATSYFLGKVKAASPTLDLKAALKKQMDGLSDAEVKAALKDCSTEARESSRALQSLSAGSKGRDSNVQEPESR